MISVIIPTFNRELITERAINSVINQSYPNIELIVVDDGSTDNTWKTLQTNLPKWNFNTETTGQNQRSILLFRIDHSGVSFARNFGCLKAKGEWICFLDSDDEWFPEKLMRQFQFHCDHSDISFSQTRELWNKNGTVCGPLGKHKKISGHYLKESLDLCLVTNSSFMAKKDAFVSLGGFRNELYTCEDYDFWNRIFLSGQSIGLVDEDLLIRYGGHPDQLSMRYAAMERFRLYSLLQTRNEYLLDGSWYQIKEENQKLWEQAILSRFKVLVNGGIKRGRNVVSLQKLEISFAQNTITNRENLEELLSDSYK